LTFELLTYFYAYCMRVCPCAGKISEPEVVTQFLVLLAAGVGTAFALDQWVGHEFPTLTVLAIFGSIISYIYSAPPLKLKQSGWIGNYALGSSYIALPWWAGQVGVGGMVLKVYERLLAGLCMGLGCGILDILLCEYSKGSVATPQQGLLRTAPGSHHCSRLRCATALALSLTSVVQ
jgi:hypothetical protein